MQQTVNLKLCYLSISHPVAMQIYGFPGAVYRPCLNKSMNLSSSQDINIQVQLYFIQFVTRRHQVNVLQTFVSFVQLFRDSVGPAAGKRSLVDDQVLPVGC